MGCPLKKKQKFWKITSLRNIYRQNNKMENIESNVVTLVGFILCRSILEALTLCKQLLFMEADWVGYKVGLLQKNSVLQLQ